MGPIDPVLDAARRHLDETERTRRLPDEVVAALRRSGIHRLTVPAALGGRQGPVVELLDAIERIAAVDASTAWCAVIGAGSNVFAGYLPEAAAREVFADPDQGNATMFAPAGRLTPAGRPAAGDHPGAGDGAARLDGRWPFASNCLHSAWIGLGALVEGPDGPEPTPQVAFVPMADVTVEDTWDSVGLRGTGSHHVEVRGVAVPPDHRCSFADRPWAEGTLWRLPLYTVLLPALAAAPLGIARGALDEVGRQLRDGRQARRGLLADDPVGLAELAVAELRLRAARALLWDRVEEAHELAERGDEVGRQRQAEVYLAALHACDAAVEATTAAHQLGGGDAAYAGSPLLRALCDVQAARQHQLFAHKHRAGFVKVLAGVASSYPPFLR